MSLKSDQIRNFVMKIGVRKGWEHQGMSTTLAHLIIYILFNTLSPTRSYECPGLRPSSEETSSVSVSLFFDLFL